MKLKDIVLIGTLALGSTGCENLCSDDDRYSAQVRNYLRENSIGYSCDEGFLLATYDFERD